MNVVRIGDNTLKVIDVVRNRLGCTANHRMNAAVTGKSMLKQANQDILSLLQ